MTSRDFAYWLQGVFEVNDPKTLNESQVVTIRAHLNMVFIHEIDPSMGDEKKQAALNNAHAKPTPSPYDAGATALNGHPGLKFRC